VQSEETIVSGKSIRNQLIIFAIILLASFSISNAFGNYTIFFIGILVGLVYLVGNLYYDIVILKKAFLTHMPRKTIQSDQPKSEKSYEVEVNGVKLRVDLNEYIKYLEANQKR
jgi:hypothetical protein